MHVHPRKASGGGPATGLVQVHVCVYVSLLLPSSMRRVGRGSASRSPEQGHPAAPVVWPLGDVSMGQRASALHRQAGT